MGKKKADADGIYWEQDPSANLDYSINWASALAEVSTTIVSALWSISPSGPTMHSDIFTTTLQKVWVSGVVDGTTYWVAGKVWGADGQFQDRKRFRIKGKEGG